MCLSDPTQALRVEFLLTKRHLWQYHWYCWRRQAGRRLLLLAAVCLILPTLNFIPGYNSGVSGTLALSMFLSVTLFLAQGIVFVGRLLFGFRKTLKSGTTGERFAEVGKFDFAWGAAASPGYCYHWSYFEDIIRTQNAIYFVLTRQRGLIVPKSAFADTAQEEKFLAMAHAQWEIAKTSQRYAATEIEGVWPPPPRRKN